MKYAFYQQTGRHRKMLWRMYYSVVSLGLSKSTLVQNSGFALVSATGESL